MNLCDNQEIESRSPIRLASLIAPGTAERAYYVRHRTNDEIRLLSGYGKNTNRDWETRNSDEHIQPLLALEQRYFYISTIKQFLNLITRSHYAFSFVGHIESHRPALKMKRRLAQSWIGFSGWMGFPNLRPICNIYLKAHYRWAKRGGSNELNRIVSIKPRPFGSVERDFGAGRPNGTHDRSRRNRLLRLWHGRASQHPTCEWTRGSRAGVVRRRRFDGNQAERPARPGSARRRAFARGSVGSPVGGLQTETAQQSAKIMDESAQIGISAPPMLKLADLSAWRAERQAAPGQDMAQNAGVARAGPYPDPFAIPTPRMQ